MPPKQQNGALALDHKETGSDKMPDMTVRNTKEYREFNQIRKSVHDMNAKFSRDRDIKKRIKQILETNSVSEVKNTVGSLNYTLGQAGERSDLEHRTFEINLSAKKKKKLKRTKMVLGISGIPSDELFELWEFLKEWKRVA